MLKLNGLYRIKSGHGSIDSNYKDDNKVKFVKYLGESIKGHDRIRYALLNWKGEELYRGNKFKSTDVDTSIRYIIKA